MSDTKPTRADHPGRWVLGYRWDMPGALPGNLCPPIKLSKMQDVADYIEQLEAELAAEREKSFELEARIANALA